MMNVPAAVSTTACLGGVWASIGATPPQTITTKTQRTRSIQDERRGPSCASWLRGSIAFTPRKSSHPLHVEDPRDLPDVVESRHQRDDERRIHAEIDDHGMVAQVIEEHRERGGQDICRGGDLS